MALTDLNHMLAHAYHHGYALGAFRVDNLSALQTVMAAAEETRAPVALTPGTGTDLDLLLPALEAAAERARVPVALQMGEVDCHETLTRAMRLGCNGIRVAVSNTSFARRIQTAQELVATARACGLAAAADSSEAEDATPSEACTFAERTEADGLMIRLLPNNGSGKGRIDYNWIRHVHRTLDRPLGVATERALSMDQYRRLLGIGVAEIEHGKAAVPEADQDKASVAACLRACGAAGRAAEVVAQCASWQGTEHLILCDPPELDESRAAALLSEGERVLADLPGVRSAQASCSLAGSGPYRYAWRVRLCHRDALSAFHMGADPTVSENRFEALIEGCLRIDLETPGPNVSPGQPRAMPDRESHTTENVTPLRYESRRSRA